MSEIKQCNFPDCHRDYKRIEGLPDACLEHRRLVRDVLFILNHLKNTNVIKPESVIAQVLNQAGIKRDIPKQGNN